MRLPVIFYPSIKIMKKLIFTFTITFLSLSGFSQISIIVNADQGKETISRHIYGHFAEHLGRCIYDGFYVGESNKSIPNKDCIRIDIIDALKKLKIPNLRWPGGCFADTYHLKDGIGPKEKRPSRLNVWWGGFTENNSFVTHDFLKMCEMLETEPYLSGNVGSGTVQELSDWVKYVNHKEGSSPMPLLRQQNGREKPWNVKFWGIGNEAWGCGGNMKTDYYANIYRQYAIFLTDWSNDNKIFRIASGANSSDYNWTEVLTRDIPHGMLEGVALHDYAVIDWNKKSSATNFSDEEYFITMKRVLLMEELVTRHSTIMDKYDPAKKVALVVDEWGGWYDVEHSTNGAFLYQQNTMRDAMIAGVTLNIFNNHSDRVRMAKLAQTVNVLQAFVLTNGNKLILTLTYHVMEMYKVHQDAVLLPLKITSGDFVSGNEKLPAVSASASKDKNGMTHILMVNIDNKMSQDISVDIRGLAFKTLQEKYLYQRAFKTITHLNKQIK
jgi:alpha-N-arabinofuranosidase